MLNVQTLWWATVNIIKYESKQDIFVKVLLYRTYHFRSCWSHYPVYGFPSFGDFAWQNRILLGWVTVVRTRLKSVSLNAPRPNLSVTLWHTCRHQLLGFTDIHSIEMARIKMTHQPRKTNVLSIETEKSTSTI